MKFLDVFQGKLGTPPLWLMRQAGRYLPEYRAIRENATDFLSFCLTPKQAIEVTLQPIRRFDFDAAIIFSDILVVPHALGQRVLFEKGEGPKCGPLVLDEAFWNQDFEKALETLTPVFEAVSGVRAELPAKTALIGFCGAPWTVMTYMVEGGKTRDFKVVLNFVRENPAQTQRLLNLLADFSARYLASKVKAGAQVVQLFDSWAGVVPDDLFEELVLNPTQRLIRTFRFICPQTPVIGFPKGTLAKASLYAKTGIDALGVDQGAHRPQVVSDTPQSLVLQGNLDPEILIAGGEKLREEISRIHADFSDRPYIFNLGHGIKPETSIENVEKFVTWVRDLR